MFVIGVVLLLGAVKRWPILLEAPDYLFPLNLLPKVFGGKLFAPYYIITGLVFIIASIVMFIVFIR